jgi:hypothetical protein
LRKQPYISQADILHQGGVEAGFLDDLLEDFEDEAVERGVFEASLAGFGERRADGEGDDDVVGVLCGAGIGLDC